MMETNKDYDSDQLAAEFRKYPIDDHGKVRFQYFNISALEAALADGSTIGLAWLPPGRKRFLPSLSQISHSAFGGGRTLDIGHGKYLDRPSGLATANSDEDPNAFAAAIDVSAAGTAVAWGSALKFDMYSLDEPLLFATVNGGTMPVGATLEGYIAYLYE